MKQLNNTSTHIFLKLVIKLGSEEQVQLQSKSSMPLTFAFLQNVQMDKGEGKLYRLSHTYVQNGHGMRDPEMCFLVEINSEEANTAIYPTMYQQDSLGLYEESVHINDGKVTGFIPVWQSAHCAFANMWLKQIKAQGFLAK